MAKSLNSNSLFSRKSLRRALRDWHQAEKLGSHLLVNSTLVQKEVEGKVQTSFVLGGVLRQILRRGIDALKPNNDTPDHTAPGWRPFIILTKQYINQVRPDVVASQLSISRSTYNHAQADAFDRLSHQLKEWEEKAKQEQQPSERPRIFESPPLPPHHLIGRDVLLAKLKEALLAENALSSVALTGLPGVGKTTMALMLAHDAELLSHYEDGILWARLGQNADPSTILNHWARLLKIPRGEIEQADSIQATVDLIHAQIGIKHMLLVVDDAWDVETALIFRLGGPHCSHLMTTRLPDIAVHFAGQNIFAVPELSNEHGMQLMQQMVPKLVKAYPETCEQLVNTVAGLPFALLLIGKHLQILILSEQDVDLQMILDQLVAQVEMRLELTQPQAPIGRHPSLPFSAKISLKSIIDISFSKLDEQAQQLLKAISLFPAKPNSFLPETAVSISGQSAPDFKLLETYGLVEMFDQGRYTLHQSIADFIRQLNIDDGVYERYVHYFEEYVTVHDMDFNIIEPELSNLLKMLSIALDRGMDQAFMQGVNHFYHFLHTRSLYTLAEPYLEKALDITRASEDIVGEIATLANLGRLAINRAQYDIAENYLREGLLLSRQVNDLESISRMLQAIGVVYDYQGDYSEAKALYVESLVFAKQAGNDKRVCTLLMNLGGLSCDLGEYDQAEAFLQEGLQIARDINHEGILSPMLLNLGAVAGDRGNYQKEKSYYQEALIVARKMEHREDICFLLTNLGSLADSQGEYELAESYLVEGINIARETELQERLSSLLNHLSSVEINRKNYSLAKEYVLEGIDLARDIGHRKNQSALLRNLGVIEAKQKNYEEANICFRESLVIACEIEHQWFIAETNIRWGDAYFELGEYEKSTKLYEGGLRLAEQIKGQELIGFALLGLARVKKCLGDLPGALLYSEKSFQIFQSIEHREKEIAKAFVMALHA